MTVGTIQIEGDHSGGNPTAFPIGAVGVAAQGGITVSNSLPGPLTIIFTPATIAVGAHNAGQIAGSFAVTAGSQTTPIANGGAYASYFTTDNSGMCPCHLILAVDVPDGSALTGYAFTFTAS
jgi:hypothetical protein